MSKYENLFEVEVQDELTQDFPYEIGDDTIACTIRYVSEDEMQGVVSKSQKHVFNKGVRSTETDQAKFKRKIVKTALVDIKGAKLKHLKYLVEPHIRLRMPPGVEEKDLSYDGQVKDTLLKYINGDFASEIAQKCNQFAEWHEEQEKEDLENLNDGSNIRGAQKDKPSKT